MHAKHVDDTALVAGRQRPGPAGRAGAPSSTAGCVAAHQRAGVTVRRPGDHLDRRRRRHRAATPCIRPGTQLHGAHPRRRRLRRSGPDTTLTDVIVGDGATVVRTHGSASTIGDRRHRRPVHLPAARHASSARDGKLGTFVEIKNADDRRGHQGAAPDLRRRRRPSASTATSAPRSVFVNYDGEHKHRTIVGSHVRTGSDTMFVAPVTVGDGAYTGAGTVLREDVPPGALAVSAGPQRNIEGWVLRKRPGSDAGQRGGRATAAAADSAVRRRAHWNPATRHRTMARIDPRPARAATVGTTGPTTART